MYSPMFIQTKRFYVYVLLKYFTKYSKNVGLGMNCLNLPMNHLNVNLLFLQNAHLPDIMFKLVFAIGKPMVSNMIIIMKCLIVFQTS